MARHPAFAQGMEAFRRGILTNPNKDGTIAYKEWLAGFDHAYFLNQHELNSHMKGNYYV